MKSKQTATATATELSSEMMTTLNSLSTLCPKPPDLCVVLGSGFGGAWVEQLPDAKIIPYANIKGFPTSGVEGHAGRLILTTIKNKEIALFEGRSHYYETADIEKSVLASRLMAFLGVSNFLFTNASGGLNDRVKPGDLMVIESHVGFLMPNPLVGPNNSTLGTRFPDMSEAYNEDMRNKIMQVFDGMGLNVRLGTYAAVSGPSYETKAEVKFLRACGVDLVGMSTVPDVIVLNHMKRYTFENKQKTRNIRIGVISCVANMSGEKSEHKDVLKAVEKGARHFVTFLPEFIKTMQ